MKRPVYSSSTEIQRLNRLMVFTATYIAHQYKGHPLLRLRADAVSIEIFGSSSSNANAPKCYVIRTYWRILAHFGYREPLLWHPDHM
jgi:hypothetical protein